MASGASRGANALDHVKRLHDALAAGDRAQLARHVSAALWYLDLPQRGAASAILRYASGLAREPEDSLELLDGELAGLDADGLRALSRGFALVGAYRAGGRARRLARDMDLAERPSRGSERWEWWLRAMVDRGDLDTVRLELSRDAGAVRRSRALRWLGIYVGESSDTQLAGRELAEIVESHPVVLEGPLSEYESSGRSQTRGIVSVRFKYLGHLPDDGGATTCDISVVNGHAYRDLEAKFGASSQGWTMRPCRLLLYKAKRPPQCHLGIQTMRLAARPAVYVEKASLGPMTILELLAAKPQSLTLRGIDLHLGELTHGPSYPLFDTKIDRDTNGGMTSVGVARSGGIHEPISQFNFLKHLHDAGRILAEERLAAILRLDESEFAIRLEQRHGFPFLRRQVASG